MRGDETSTISGFRNPAERGGLLDGVESPLPELGLSTGLVAGDVSGLLPRKKPAIFCHSVSFGGWTGGSGRLRGRPDRRPPFLEGRFPLVGVYSDDIGLIWCSGGRRGIPGETFSGARYRC